MDSKQAKFVLQSFRPDGADAKDPEFAEALALAAGDRELGEWLAAERAEDAAFAEALAGIEIPNDLRDHIFAVLRGDLEAETYSDMDAVFVGALASVEPPTGLRDQIVAAMNVERGSAAAKGAPRRISVWMKSAAIAAALALGAWVAISVTAGDDLRIAKVEQESIRILQASDFTLDLKNQRQADLYAFLESNELPSPNILPAGLENVPGVGCKELRFQGKPASLLCYMKEGVGVVHLVVMRRGDVSGDLPSLDAAKDACKGCDVTGWSVASWSDEERAFILLGKMEPAQLAAVF